MKDAELVELLLMLSDTFHPMLHEDTDIDELYEKCEMAMSLVMETVSPSQWQLVEGVIDYMWKPIDVVD